MLSKKIFNKSIIGSICLLPVILFYLSSPVLADGYTSGSKDSIENRINFVGKTIIGRFGLKYRLDKSGFPTSINGNLSKGLTSTIPLEMAYEFFESNKDIFPIQNANKELVVWQQIGGDEHFGPTIKFYWCVDSIKVSGMVIVLNYSRDGKLYYYDGKFDLEAREVDTEPVITEKEAKEIAVKDKRSGGEVFDNTTSDGLIIINVAGKYFLTWAVTCGYTSYWIDAKTGTVVKTEPSAVY